MERLLLAETFVMGHWICYSISYRLSLISWRFHLLVFQSSLLLTRVPRHPFWGRIRVPWTLGYPERLLSQR